MEVKNTYPEQFRFEEFSFVLLREKKFLESCRDQKAAHWTLLPDPNSVIKVVLADLFIKLCSRQCD